MQNQVFTFQRWYQVVLLVVLLPAMGATQTNDPMLDRFEEMIKRMDAQMRMGMPFDTTFEGGQFHFSPDSNSYYYFHIDTSFNGSGGEHFDFSPFSSPNFRDFFGGDPFFDQFFERIRPEGPRQEPHMLPKDDGQLQGADDLLPEERLRMQDGQSKSGEKTDKPKKPDVKTIRI